jgi:uncharacterized BrkB/YihY/UPF0761 family membrane protein
MKSKILQYFGLLWQALKKFNRDNGFFLSSGISFNVLVNLIPFMLLLLAMVGTYLYNDEKVLSHIHGYLREVAPALDPEIMKNLRDVIQNRRVVGILGFAGVLWFSTLLFTTLRSALNIVFMVEKSRGILRGIGIDLLMVVLAGSCISNRLSLNSLPMESKVLERLQYTFSCILGGSNFSGGAQTARGSDD